MHSGSRWRCGAGAATPSVIVVAARSTRLMTRGASPQRSTSRTTSGTSKRISRADVVRDFEDGYAQGITPNPCVRCNQRIKFGVLLERARAAGATHLVTGHYARTGRRGALATLHRARDPRRDQAYVLHRLDQHQLQSAVFPLGGDESKAGVRAEAAQPRARNRSQAGVAGSLLRGDGHQRPSSASGSPGVSQPATSPIAAAPCLAGTTACRSSPWGSEPAWGSPLRTPDAHRAT